MAVVFTKEPQGTYLDAYNNSVFEFGTNSGIAARAIVELGGFNLEVYPIDGTFYINLKDVISVLVNMNNFMDNVFMDNPLIFIYPDTTLYHEISVKFKIIKSNGLQESFTKTLKYFKSASQIIEPRFQQNDQLRFLVPSIDDRPRVTYFEGLPFDLSIFSNAVRLVNIKNKRTGINIDVQFLKGVNRLFLSNGENDNLGFEDSLPLYIGINVLEFTWDDKIETIYVKKMPYECGRYVKFFNQKGGWSYWRMHKDEKITVKSSILDTINSDFENIDKAISRELSTGRRSEQSILVSTGKMDDYETLLLSHIFKSPRTYLLSVEGIQPFTLESWKVIDVVSGNNEVANTRYKKFESILSLQLPKDYTQVYAS